MMIHSTFGREEGRNKLLGKRKLMLGNALRIHEVFAVGANETVGLFEGWFIGRALNLKLQALCLLSMRQYRPNHTYHNTIGISFNMLHRLPIQTFTVAR